MLANHKRTSVLQNVLLLSVFLTIVFLFLFAVLSQMDFGGSYAESAKVHQVLCSTNRNISLSAAKECESFWYKAFSDPAVFFAMGTLVINAILAVSAIGALWVTLHGINRQQINAEKLFILDQRPRLAVNVSLGHPIFEFNEHHWTAVNILYSIENIGKTVAIDVSEPLMEYHNFSMAEPNVDFLRDLSAGKIQKQKDYNSKLIGVRDELRNKASEAFFLPGGVIQAGRTFSRKMAIYIPRSVTDKIFNEPKVLNFHFIFIVLTYKGEFTKDQYESTLAFNFKYGAVGSGSLPRSEQELKMWSSIEDLTSAMSGFFAEASLEESSSLSIFT